MTEAKHGFWSWFKRHVAAMIVVLLAAGGVMAISSIEVPKEEIKATPAPPANVDVMPVVRLTAATAGERAAELRDSFEMLGSVRPNRTVDVCAEVAATVEALPREKGQTVAAGDLLVALNTDLLQADINRIEAQLKYNQTDLDRIVSLLSKGHATQQEADVARTTLDVTKAELSAAAARLKRAKIHAPFAGVLNERAVELGAFLAPGMKIGTIVDMSVAKVTVDVPERDIAFVRLGQEQEVCADAGGLGQSCDPTQKAIKGKVTYISQLADEQTHTTRVEISVANGSGELQSGQMVKVRLTRRVLDELILVPLGAIIPMENDKAVFVVEASKDDPRQMVARQRIVRMGAIKGANVQILSGLREGEKLILPGGNRLVSDEQKVNVMSTDPATKPATQTK